MQVDRIMLLPCPRALQRRRLVLHLSCRRGTLAFVSHRGGCGFPDSLVRNQGFIVIFVGAASGSDQLCQRSLSVWSAVR